MAETLETHEIPVIEVGNTYKTYGGWDVKVIHITATKDLFYTVHYPGQVGLESNPVLHMMPTGIARSAFSINEPPQYDVPKPADIDFSQ